MPYPIIPGKEPPEVIARPRCQHCGDRLKPYMAVEWATKPGPEGAVYVRQEGHRRYWTGHYSGYPVGEKVPLFCKTPCAIEFAAAAHRAGYMVKR